jgi:MFS family permease
MVAADAGRVVVLLAATATVLAHGVSLPLLLVVAVVFGTVDALYLPASGTLPRQLVRPDDLGRTAALNQLGSRLATLLGAPLGGAVVALGGIEAVMLLDAASFVAVGLVVALVLRPRFPLPRSTGASVLADLGAGFGYLRRTPPVRSLVIALSGLNLFVGPSTAVGLALRVQSQHWGAASLGVLEAAIGAGAAVGAVAAVRWSPRRPARTGLLILVGQAAACAAVGVADRPVLLAAMLLVGVTAGLASAFCSGAFQRAVDGAYQGRTGSLISLGDNVLMPVAMTAYGALAAGAGLPLTAALTGAAFAALVLWSASRPGIDLPPSADEPPAQAEGGRRAASPRRSRSGLGSEGS